MGGKLVTAKAKATGTNLCWGSTEKNRAGAGTHRALCRYTTPECRQAIDEWKNYKSAENYLLTAELPEIGAQQFGCWIAKLLRLK